MLLLILSILLFAVLISLRSNPRYSMLLEGKEKLDEIIATRTAADNLLKELRFNQHVLPYDAQTRTFYYSIPESGRSRFDPLVSWEGSEKGVSLSFFGQSFSQLGMQKNKRYEFAAYTDSSYTVYGLILTSLPVITIRTENDDVSPERPIGEEDIMVQFWLYDNRANATVYQRNISTLAKMHIRGGSSRAYPKNSYKISLKQVSLGGNIRNNHVSLLGMEQDDDWILYAAYNDPERMRNTFSNYIWYQMGTQRENFGMVAGTMGKFVELIINDRYWGIYVLMRPIDSKSLRLAEKTTLTKQEYQYRSISWKQTTSRDFLNAGEKNVVGRFEIRYPKDSTDPCKWDPLVQWLRIFEADDNNFVKELFEMGDKKNLIDYWIFLNLTLAVDNDGKNTNYTAKWIDGRYHMILDPWDLDLTWGNLWDGKLPLLSKIDLNTKRIVSGSVTGVPRALELGVDGLIEDIQQRYTYLRQTVLSDRAVEEILSEYQTDVYGSGAILRDKERWPVSAYSETPDAFFEFVRQRFIQMDLYVAGLGEGTDDVR